MVSNHILKYDIYSKKLFTIQKNANDIQGKLRLNLHSLSDFLAGDCYKSTEILTKFKLILLILENSIRKLSFVQLNKMFISNQANTLCSKFSYHLLYRGPYLANEAQSSENSFSLYAVFLN